ncbi:YHYH protein [Luteolibacter sp. AS25]|uniref:YHYH protein n=1 Tax=Luteolibacter sp. AS25 TaxID=3135776 RepID=UPI00398AABD9
MTTRILSYCSISLALITAAGAQTPDGQGGPPPNRNHTENTARPLDLVPADQQPPTDNKVTITIEGDKRIIHSNAIPEHLIGKFPNAENPNTIAEQSNEIKLPLNPKANKESVPARPVAGIFLNGVFIESGTGEFWSGEGSKPWNYEALGNAVGFGLDENYAHVQPGGKYHYHGKPTAFLKQMDVTEDKHSPLVGWAFDGFPIYALYGYADPEDPASEIVEMTSSYRLREGTRPSPPEGPGGTYDGAFSDDYEYVEGSGTLDECNGRFTKTPDFPDGTYAYFLSNEYPVILRNFRGTSAMGGPGGAGPGGPGGPPGSQQGRPPGQPPHQHGDEEGHTHEH